MHQRWGLEQVFECDPASAQPSAVALPHARREKGPWQKTANKHRNGKYTYAHALLYVICRARSVGDAQITTKTGPFDDPLDELWRSPLKVSVFIVEICVFFAGDEAS